MEFFRLQNRGWKMNNTSTYVKMAKLPSYLLAASFLAIHIAMLILFLVYKIMPMFYFNIFSVIFYMAMFPLIHFNHLRILAVGTFVEVLVHMILAVYFVGWSAGFQITLIGVVILGFYAEYTSRMLEERPVPGIAMGLILFAGYEVSYILTKNYPPRYRLPEAVNFWLQIAWGAAVFLIVILFLKIFVMLAFRSEKRLEKQVAHDSLTGLLTRYFMDDYLKQLMNEPNIDQYWFAMIDIDDFKDVNDTYGHNCGDYVLRTMADIFSHRISGVQVCRWGGEEFLLVGRIEKDMELEVEKLEQLRKSVEAFDFFYEGQHFELTVTIGVAAYQEDQIVQAWVERADKHLYFGKNHGKNQVVTELTDADPEAAVAGA